jgi:ATP-dependent exoDNAse (exonuclease V) beta subunit
LIHKWFELVDFIGDDTGPSDDALRESAKDAMGVRTPTQEQARWIGERLTEFRRMLASEPVRAALARPAGEFELWRERAFAVAQDGRVLRGQFDRVVVRRSGGAVVGADLVDFKTDQPVGGDVGPLVETYRPQIEAYRAAAASMLAVTVSAITARLLFVTLGKSVAL